MQVTKEPEQTVRVSLVMNRVEAQQLFDATRKGRRSVQETDTLLQFGDQLNAAIGGVLVDNSVEAVEAPA